MAGSHWATDVQVDVVAIAWREKCILLGESKWRIEDVGRSVVRELVEEKTPRVLAALPDGGEGWTVHYAFFAGSPEPAEGRTGFTEAALAEAARHRLLRFARNDRGSGHRLVNLATFDRDLRRSDRAGAGE